MKLDLANAQAMGSLIVEGVHKAIPCTGLRASSFCHPNRQEEVKRGLEADESGLAMGSACRLI